jgi:hypothetical protein
MPASSSSEPLRGDAAWRAELKEIAKRNDAAQQAGAARRRAKEATAAEEAMRRARREARDYPKQPGA